MLSIHLLGTPQIRRDGEPIHITRRKSRALVYYLAASDKPVTRDHLLTFFWPDLERAAAQQTLRTTLHGLRRSLGSALVVDEDTLTPAPDTDVDTRLFQSRLSSPITNYQSPITNLHLLTSTLDLYRGDFLSDFTLPDTPQFDDWASVERERYRRLAIRGLAALSRAQEAKGDLVAALDAIDRALASDPLQEDLQRAALRLHYLSGDRAGAIRRYEALRKLLDEEMGVPPMAETRELYDAIIKDTLQEIRDQGPALSEVEGLEIRPVKPQRRSDSRLEMHRPISNLQSLPFVGRATELEALTTAAADNMHKLLLIEGEPGIGKTRLAETFVLSSGGLSLAGRARELEMPLPYQPLIEALRALAGRPDWPALYAGVRETLSAVWLVETARLLPELAPPAAEAHSPSPADESRLWEGVYQFLVALSRQRYVILFLDDLRWADASTLALLGYLVHRRPIDAPDAPITFLAATQSPALRSPLAALVQTLTREGRLHRLSLTRLPPDALTALAKNLSPGYAYPLATWLAQNSEGIPYILSELVRYARENGILLDDGAVNLTALSASPTVPQTVYALIHSRLARLSDGARRVLDAAVAVGREFDFEVVARAAALSETAALDALDELRAAGLIAPLATGDQRYAFDHSLTMEVAYREVGEPRHRLLHRRVAEAMEMVYRSRIDTVAGLLASHFSEGNAPERAAPYALRAARQAADLAASKEAIAFYEQALAGVSDDERGPIHAALGDVRMQAGDFARAAESLRAALALAEPGSAEASEIRATLGQAFLSQARYAEAIALAQDILAEGSPGGAARARLLWGTALSLEGADLTNAAAHLNAAAAQVDSRSNPTMLAHITFELGSVAAQQGDLQRAVSLYREALEIADSATGPEALPRRILCHNNLAYHLHLLGDAAAAEHANIGFRLAQEHGVLGMYPYLLSTLGEIALAQSNVESAERQFAEGLALAESFSARERIAGLTANLGLVARKRGDTALAIHRLSTALARADALGAQHLAAQIRLWLVPLLPPAEARARLAEARAIAEGSGRRRLLDEAGQLEQQITGPLHDHPG
jgi:DNA-binding SARP family transcriptional activator